MAIIQSNGIMLVTSKPTHTPSAGEAKLARLENTFTFYYHTEFAWATIKLDVPETYTGNIIPDNSDLGTALQALETAIEGVSQDGNHTPITRLNSTENVSPTSTEVPSPVKGDTADVNLQSAKLEKWVYNNSWNKAFVLDFNSVTSLDYISNSSSGQVTSSTGNNATIPAVSSTKAGLSLPTHKTKLDFITVAQNIDLDSLKLLAESALKSVTNSNSIALTETEGNIIADLKISATQNGASITTASDGLRINVESETKPTAYLSKSAATTALGTGKKFVYLAANLDGAVEGVVAWT